MAKAGFTGPLMSLGTAAGGLIGGAPSGLSIASGVGNPPLEYSDEIGASIFWAGMAIPATGGPASKDRVGPGAIASVYAAFPIRTINSAPAAGAAALTTAGNATAGTPLVNVTTYAAGRAPVPVTAFGLPVTGIALDMALDVASFATSGTVTLTGTSVGNAWRYRIGQWICLLNCPTNSAQMVQVTAVPTVSTLTVSPVPLAATSGQITLTNRFNPNVYGASGAPSSVSSLAPAGTARILIPELGTSRGVGVTGSASSTGGSVLIQGIGPFGGLTSEIIAAPAGATTAWGKKTYDIFISATPQFTDAHNYTVVTSDFIGFPMSVMDVNSIVTATFAGVALTYASGSNTATIIPADTTYPATTTTGDPRGGIQLTANGPGAAPFTVQTLNGTNLLVVDQRLNPLQVALASAINPGPLLGVPAV
jgi:hypothetical protein